LERKPKFPFFQEYSVGAFLLLFQVLAPPVWLVLDQYRQEELALAGGVFPGRVEWGGLRVEK
jgi:hypothetical protein